MEYLFLENIIVHGSLGVYAEEERLGNSFIIDIKIYANFETSMKSDNLKDTVDYQRVHELIKEAASEPVHLLERLAGRIVEKLKGLEQIKMIELNIRKKNPPLLGQVGASGFFLQHKFDR